MKKYILGIMAIALAFAFSAFTPEAKQKDAKPTQQALYWYFLNGTQIDMPVIDDNTQRQKFQVFSTVGCEDQADDDCARGYLTKKVQGTLAPTVSSEDEHIKRNNE